MSMDESDCIMSDEPQLIPATGCALLANGEAIKISELRHRIDEQEQQLSLLGKQSHGLPALFADEAECLAWKQQRQITIKSNNQRLSSGRYYLGIDSGSTTTKVVLIDEDGQIAFRAG